MSNVSRPGYRTTEFWLSLIAMLLGALFGSGIVPDGGVVPQILGIVATILGALGYTVSRTAVKKAEAAGAEAVKAKPGGGIGSIVNASGNIRASDR